MFFDGLNTVRLLCLIRSSVTFGDYTSIPAKIVTENTDRCWGMVERQRKTHIKDLRVPQDPIVPLKQIEYGYGDNSIIYSKPNSIYLRRTIDPKSLPLQTNRG